MSNRKIKIKKKRVIVIKGSKTNRRWRKAKAFMLKNKVAFFGGTCLLLIMIFVGLNFNQLFNNTKAEIPVDTEAEKNDVINIQAETDFLYPDILPDVAINKKFNNRKEIIENDMIIQDFFEDFGYSTSESNRLAAQAKIFNLKNFTKGQAYYYFELAANQKQNESFIIYQISLDSFALFMNHPNTKVEIKSIKTEIKINSKTGLVDRTFFWNSFLKSNGDYRLIPKISNALKWQVDFYHVNPNDRYRILYEEKFYNNEVIEIGNMLAINYTQKDKDFFAFYFKDRNTEGYFDKEGNKVKARFLKTPVEYNIINSPFNENRLHPIHKREMPHYGTDYFANRNDPVFAIADGEISIASETKGNGKYVKIFHDETYESQYLHFNKIAEGIRKGVKVKQGDVIGFAGETGYASGVHVCFRFWKNKKQVDFTKEDIFEKTDQDGRVGNMETFRLHRDSLIRLMDNLEFN